MNPNPYLVNKVAKAIEFTSDNRSIDWSAVAVAAVRAVIEFIEEGK